MPSVCYQCVMVKKLLGVAVIAFALFYVFTQPQSAADAVRAAGGIVADAFASLVTFMTALFR